MYVKGTSEKGSKEGKEDPSKNGINFSSLYLYERATQYPLATPSFLLRTGYIMQCNRLGFQ